MTRWTPFPENNLDRHEHPVWRSTERLADCYTTKSIGFRGTTERPFLLSWNKKGPAETIDGAQEGVLEQPIRRNGAIMRHLGVTVCSVS
ncbi:MAG: hypothetical protein O2856_09130, partial [Planctomycetota bacterium]|nr:hypothetical protein [Planctomycetota bacterium]